MRHTLRLGFATLIAGLTVVACTATGGTSATSAPATSAAAVAKTATVTIKGFAFSPATLTIDTGTKVTFQNQDTANHTVSSGANRTKDGKFDQTIAGGTETTISFDTAGTFDYFCNFHSSMKATVVVK